MMYIEVVPASKKVRQYNIKFTSRDIADLENCGAVYGVLERKSKKKNFRMAAIAVRKGARYTPLEFQYWEIPVQEEHFEILRTGMEVRYSDPKNQKVTFRLYRADD